MMSRLPPELRRAPARDRVAYLRAQRRRRLALFGSLLLALALVFAGAAWAMHTLSAMRQTDPRAVASPADRAIQKLRQPFTILLLGIDRRADGAAGARSDTIILAYVHPVERWVSLLSIPRDTVAPIPGLGERKINTAYQYGYLNATAIYGPNTDPATAGGALMAETVSELLNVPVDYIAQIDFAGFERLIDAMGGIVIDVPTPLLDSSFPTSDYGYERFFIPAGLQIFDGATALRYARSRHGSSDFARAQRQQAIARAALDTARARGLIDQAGALAALTEEARRSIQTTLPIDDPAVWRDLITLAQAIDSSRIATLSINPRDVAIVAEIGSDIYWNRRDLEIMVARMLAGPRLNEEQATVQVLNGTPVNGLASRVSRALTNAGFQTLPAGNTERRQRTIIIDYAGKPATLQRLIEHLRLSTAQIFATPPADAPPQPLGADIVILLGQDYDPAWALAP